MVSCLEELCDGDEELEEGEELADLLVAFLFPFILELMLLDRGGGVLFFESSFEDLPLWLDEVLRGCCGRSEFGD